MQLKSGDRRLDLQGQAWLKLRPLIQLGLSLALMIPKTLYMEAIQAQVGREKQIFSFLKDLSHRHFSAAVLAV